MALSTFVGPTLSTIEDKEEKCPEGEKLKNNLKYLNFPAKIDQHKSKAFCFAFQFSRQKLNL